jgi:hypothetical protein
LKIAFPTDEHYPFQDEKARCLALRIVSDFDPDLLIVGSDGIDFYAVSTYDKNPERIKSSLQDEIDAWVEGQKEWRDAAPKARRRFLPGNHEDRLRRYLWRHPEIASLKVLSLANLLGLESLRVEYEAGESDRQEIVIEDRLVIKHGQYIRKGAGQSAMAELQAEHYSISTLTGHSHRGGSFFARTRAGLVQGHEGFCLCKLDPEYLVRPNWQQGILLAEVSETALSVEPIPFMDFRYRKRAVWRGKEYSV